MIDVTSLDEPYFAGERPFGPDGVRFLTWRLRRDRLEVASNLLRLKKGERITLTEDALRRFFPGQHPVWSSEPKECRKALSRAEDVALFAQEYGLRLHASEGLPRRYQIEMVESLPEYRSVPDLMTTREALLFVGRHLPEMEEEVRMAIHVGTNEAAAAIIGKACARLPRREDRKLLADLVDTWE